MKLKPHISRLILPLLLVVAVVIAFLKPSPGNLRVATVILQKRVGDVEKNFQRACIDPKVYDAIEKREIESDALTDIKEQGITLFYFENDSLVFWTDNSAVLNVSASSLKEGTQLKKLKSGWFLVMKHSKTGGDILVGISAIRHEYSLENNFLKNDFAEPIEISRNIEISDEALPGSVAVNNAAGERIFSIYKAEDPSESIASPVLLVAQFTLLLLAFYYINFFAVRIVRRNGFTKGFIYLMVSVVSLRLLMLFLDQPSEFYHLRIFDPKYYATSLFFKSLGDLLINCMLLVWMVLFAAYFRPRKIERFMGSVIVQVLSIAVIFLLTGAVGWIFKTLVIDSVISFKVYNILTLDVYSFLGLLCLAFLLICHFVTSKFVVERLKKAGVKWVLFVSVSIACGLLMLLSAFRSIYWQAIIFSALWSTFYLLAIYRMTGTENVYSPRNFLIYIALYSVFATYLVENLYEHHERTYRKFFASKLAMERDFMTEFMFQELYQRLNQDPLVKNFLVNHALDEKEITERLSTLYLPDYFNQYDLDVNLYDSYNHAIKTKDTVELNSFLNLAKDSGPALQYVSQPGGNHYYFSVVQFHEDTLLIGSMTVKLRPKVFYGQNVYPELLMADNVSKLTVSSHYHYGIYHSDRLTVQYGEYPYSYFWDKQFEFGDLPYRYIDFGDWEHIIYRVGDEVKVIVTEHQEGLFEPVATFSYLFSIFFIVSAIILGLFGLWGRRELTSGSLNIFSGSFRTKINYAILLMIVASFVIITIVTIGFLRRQYDNSYEERLLRKEKVVHSAIESAIRKQSASESLSNEIRESLREEVFRQAEINNIDVNVYNTSGDLFLASQPAIYDQGISSRKMNPEAYFKLLSESVSQITSEENVGALKYLATYAPIRNTKGATVAYLGIPYFARSKIINEEVSSFLVALMNVYVFLLICAAVLAYFISSSITRPLLIIGERIRQITLSKRNEPIQWTGRDEIGALVKEYNKMIHELEFSAQELAKGERESAWREMAKQIAHEIKNPLTPMKLSIQYLQRAIDAGDPNIAQLSRKVARTLEEQIENLSSIATAFSTFAKMPKAENEMINLNELLKSIADLFAPEENIAITFTTDSGTPVVFADKNQLVSVFNNLIKNAIQSIPERRAGFIDIHISEEDGWVVVAVSDNGSGIPRDLYDKVFVPNFTTKSSGTGLGLAITKQMVDGAGGRIWFDSAESVGTTFYVRLRKKVEL